MGPNQETPSGNVYVLHIIDYFSRFSLAWATRTCTVDDVKMRLKDFFDYFVKPVAIYSDCGTHFNRELSTWLGSMGVEHIRTPAFSPSSTGMVEKRNHILAERIC
jgi:transposase InsO family protein